MDSQRELVKRGGLAGWSGHVKDWHRWFLLLGLWFGSLLCACGQAIELPASDEQFGLPPADGLVDLAGLGQRSPSLVAKVREDIRQLRDDHGFRLYVVVESVFVTGNARQLASRLRRNWLPKGDGMVLVFELDTRGMGIGQSIEQEADPSKSPAGQVPSYETMSILTKAGEKLDRTSGETMVDSFVAATAEGYSDYFRRKEAPVPQGRTIKVGLIIVGGAAALALLGLLAALLVRRSDSRGGGSSYYFPESEASERLGAPYGGGAISSRRFGTGGGS